MKTEDVVAIIEECDQGDEEALFTNTEDWLVRFANLVEQRTREECARICEDTEQEYEPYIGTPRNLAYTCAEAIRTTSTIKDKP